MLRDIYTDALHYKRHREVKKGFLKFATRIIPLATALLFLPLAIIGQILGGSRAFNKIIYPVLNDPGNHFSEFTKKILTNSVNLLEGKIIEHL